MSKSQRPNPRSIATAARNASRAGASAPQEPRGNRSSEQTIRRQLAELDTLYRTAPVGLCLMDTDLRYVRINEELAAANGLPPDAHIGRTLHEIVPGLADRIVPTLRKVVETGEPALNVELHGTTRGRPDVERTWLASYVPVKLEDGSVVAVNTVVIDITDHKRALEDLRMFQHIVRATPDNMSFVDSSYVYRAVSDSYLIAHDLPRDKIIGRHVAELLGRDAFERTIKPKIDHCLAGRQVRYQDWFTFPALGERFMDVVYNPFVGVDGTIVGVVVSARDITERRQMEEALRESQVRLELIANTIEDVVWITDWPKKRVLFASPAYEQIWGRPVAELYNDPADWVQTVHEDDHQRVWNAASNVGRTNRYDEEYRLVRPDGSVRWVRDRGYPVRDKEGKVYQVVGIAQDITERKETEEARQKLEVQLRHAQKMQAVGQLAAGVAHDVNSLLMVILGSTEVAQTALRRRGDDGIEKATAALTQVHDAVERGKTLVQRLLAFGRARAWRPRLVNLNAVIADMRPVLSGLMAGDIRFDVKTDQTLNPCRVDSGQIEQVVLNLLLNARDALDKGGRAAIETANTRLTKAQLSGHPQAKPGPYVMLAVSDNGAGMSQDTIERIFEPFFSTKPVDKGSGLGLSIVYSIVEQAGGHMQVESQPGKGTIFRTYFPAVENE